MNKYEFVPAMCAARGSLTPASLCEGGSMGKRRMTQAVLLLVCLTAVPVLWASGTKETKPAGKPTITVWGLDAQDHILPALECYKAIENDVTIVPTWIPNTQYENKLRVAISAGSPPDVMSIDSPTIASFVDGNALAPLDAYWPKADLDDLTKATRASFTYRGKVWAAPIEENNAVVHYNKQAFEDAGLKAPTKIEDAWTIDQITQAAIKLTKKDANGKTTMYGFQPLMSGPSITHEGQNWITNLWLWDFGADIISPDGKTVDGYFNSPKSLAAMKWFADLYVKYKVAPLEDMPNGFVNGQIAMYTTGTWQFAMNNAVKDLKWGAMPLPKGERQASNNGGWSKAMSSKTKDKALAFKVIMATCSRENFNHIYLKIWPTILPPRTSSFSDPALPQFSKDPFPLVLTQLNQTAITRPITPAYPTIAEALQKCFSDLAFGKDPAEAMKEYSQMMNDALAKVNK